MKCKQKSCNRNKNLLGNGYCNVCTEAIMDVNAEHDAKKKVNEALIKDLIGMNDKLGRKEIVDQNRVNRLIMSGIIALIDNHTKFDENQDARIVDLEVEKNTSKNRLESLESWTLKQDDKLKDMKDNADKECETIELLKKKLTSLKDVPNNTKEKDNQVIKCKLCKKAFSRNCDLEIHMDEHETERKYKCNNCEKTFHLQWRRDKHEENHKQTNVTVCRYFSKHEPCPYEPIGCKFLHDQSTTFCRKKDCQNLLCPFAHQNVTRDEDKEGNCEEVSDAEQEVSDEEQEETLTVLENQCHLCRLQLATKNQFYYHIEVHHEEYFRGMMEIIETTNKSSLNMTLGVS